MATHNDLGFRSFVGECLWYVAAVEAEWVAWWGAASAGRAASRARIATLLRTASPNGWGSASRGRTGPRRWEPRSSRPS